MVIRAKSLSFANRKACLAAAVNAGIEGPKSMVDDDLYKLTMANAVLHLHPNRRVKYRFTDRSAKKWTQEAVTALQGALLNFAKLKLTSEEKEYGKREMPWINRTFWDWLANYRYDPSEIKVWLDQKGCLQIEFSGLWCRTILWEVKALYTVAEVYFKMVDTDWSEGGQEERMLEKIERLAAARVMWADFGTRRRRNFGAQERVVRLAKEHADRLATMGIAPNFTGTSNVFLAMKYGIKALGTMAHEWIMGHAAIFGLNKANYFALNNWQAVYNGALGTALPDTYGTEAFCRDFDGTLARLFDSVRHDSGDAYKWFDRMVAHYKSIGVNAKEKPFGFTDGNDVDSALAIKEYVTKAGYKCWFGIGTHMTNDYPGSKACNIVIKLTEVDVDGRWIQVVKISDTPSKASGDPEMVRIALNIHFGVPLDHPSHAERKAPYAEPVPDEVVALSPRRRSNAARHLDRLAA